MIKNIKMHNFLSWRKGDIDLPSGITRVDGFNYDDNTSEGSGKSALFNAIAWCLYGKLPKKNVKLDDVITKGQSTCKVKIEFEQGFSILRSRKPNDLYIIKNGEKIKGSTSKQTDQMIVELIGLNFDTFCQTIYFAQNYDKKFLNSNQEEKATILTEIIDVKKFDQARKSIMRDIKTIKHQIELKQVESNGFRNEISTLKLLINSLESRSNDLLNRLNGELDNLELEKETNVERGKDIKAQLKEFKAAKKAYDKTQLKESENVEKLKEVYTACARQLQIKKEDLIIRDKIIEENDSIKRTLTNYKRDIDDSQRQLDKINNFLDSDKDECNTCGQPVDKCKGKVRDLKANKKELTKYIKEIKAKGKVRKEELKELPDLSETQDLVESLNKERLRLDREYRMAKSTFEANELSQHKRTQKIVSCDIKLEDIKSKLDSIKESKSNLKAKIKKIKEEDSNIDELNEKKLQLKTIKETRESLVQDILELQKKLSSMEKLKSGFKDVKTYIFQNVLHELNRRVKIYIDQLFEVDLKLEFSSDGTKIDTMTKVDKEDRTLGLFSGGQTRRMNLAVDLALSDIITTRKNSALKLIILDEYFKDLSESSMEKCIELLRNLKKPTLIIEHNSIFKTVVDESIEIQYKNGVSELCQ